jgi:WD40 repeat protein
MACECIPCKWWTDDLERRNGKCSRNLYTKQYGHSDWVTSCKFLKDGRVWSAGMDNKMCLWDARAVRCQTIQGHNSTISKIMVDHKNIGVSGSYDSSLLVWNLDTITCLSGLFNGHSEPVVEFDWRNSLVVSGDRGGSMAIWDINTGQSVRQMKNPHSGAVSKIKFYSDGVDAHLILSVGLKDGCLVAHDMRTHQPVARSQVHSAAVNMLATNLSGFVVTGAADSTIKTFDIFNSLKPVQTMKTTDAVFCGETLDNLILVGCGDGNVLSFDSDSGECLWGYGADP